MRNGTLSVLFDLRCLQDPAYKDRGVGRVAANLIGSSEQLGRHIPITTVGLVDPNMPALEDRFSRLVENIRTNAYDGNARSAKVFIELSPMTHDPLYVGRLVNHADFELAFVHDFIPLLEPDRYMPKVADRVDYQTKLFWLSRYDAFATNSRHTADELQRLLGVDESRIFVAGAPVGAALEKILGAPRIPSRHGGEYVLVCGGADARKNVECALRAHANSRFLQHLGIPLVVMGNYPTSGESNLKDFYAAQGGQSDLLIFAGFVGENELSALFQNATLVVVPAKSEGFSIPVVEAMAAGAPVIASRIPAHVELIGRDDLLFAQDDALTLTIMLEHLVAEPMHRLSIVRDQAARWQKFRSDDVAVAFWENVHRFICAAGEVKSPKVLRRSRPRVAFMTPVPPDKSGVADYSGETIKELGALVDVDVFVPKMPLQRPPGAASVQPISALASIHSAYDRVIGVVGNSHFHLDIFQQLLRYGGACIEHDNRLLGFYSVLLGEARAAAVAERELRRKLTPGELQKWLADEATLEATFLGELAAAAAPLVLHSRGTAQLVRERFGVEPVYLPFSIYRDWPDELLTSRERQQARERLGIPPEEFAVVTLGFVHSSKAPVESIWAVQLLRAWGIQAKLYFVGEINGAEAAPLEALAHYLGVGSQVHFLSNYVNDRVYRDYVLSADAAIQLRTHLLGGLSGALLDCIAAGVPSIANEDLAVSMEAPSYIWRIPDRSGPVLLAEALAAIATRGPDRDWIQEERSQFTKEHNFKVYSERLCGALELDLSGFSSKRLP